MNCRRVEQRLSNYVEGRLPAREAGAVTVHLRDCPACCRLREELLAAGAALRELAAPAPRADLPKRAVESWLAERQAPGVRRQSPVRPTVFGQWGLGRVLSFATAAMLAAALGLALTRWERGRVVARRSSPLVGRPHAESMAANAGRPSTIRPFGQREAKGKPMAGGGRPSTRGGGFAGVRIRPGGHPVRLAGTRANSLPREADYRPHSGNHTKATASWRDPRARSRLRDDLAFVNRDPRRALQQWARLSPDDWDRIERRVRETVRVRDDFVQIPFPRLASTSDRPIAAAVEGYKREAAIVDPRLAREVTLQFKATALSDLCDHLRTETGIRLAAGPSVADEKVTLFCEKLPLRDVMRQMSRPFGYTWIRTRKEGGDYQYELVQDLRSQLMEEELRNRDRNAALIALDREMDRYRPYVGLSPDEALARSKSAAPGDKKLLATLSGAGWGPIHMYYRLSPQEQAALRAGQELKFSQDPKPGEQPLPPEIARGVLEARRELRVVRENSDKNGGAPPQNDGQLRFVRGSEVDGMPLSAVPETRAEVTLKLNQTELGRFGLSGHSTVSVTGSSNGEDNGPYAVGLSPAVLQPENAAINAQLAGDPALRRRVTVVPVVSGQWLVASKGNSVRSPTAPPGAGYPRSGPTAGDPVATGKKITSADALAALHRATGMPIVADFYTHLYAPETSVVHDQPLFEALNHLSDATRLRWNKEGEWLQFRCASFYNDRLKEVPNRLLARWAAARRQHGNLTLDDLIEIAGLSDAQLDARDMDEGAKEIWGLSEWDLACNRELRPHLRWISGFSPAERQKVQRAPGLRFTELTLPQQQQFIALAIGSDASAIDSLEELGTAAVQVDYSLPGGFEWKAPEKRGGPPEPLAPVRSSTREGALAAGRRIDPQADPAQIQPTEMAFTLLYRWGTPQSNGLVRIYSRGREDTSVNRSRSKSGP